jgi:hypothetical protein
LDDWDNIFDEAADGGGDRIEMMIHFPTEVWELDIWGRMRKPIGVFLTVYVFFDIPGLVWEDVLACQIAGGK